VLKIPPELPPVDASRPRTFRLADLLVLIACVALGLACARWEDPYSYRAPRLADPEWLFFQGLVPAIFGAANLGLPATMLLQTVQRRRREGFSAMELAGLVTTCAIVTLFGLETLFAHSRGPGILLWLMAAVTVGLAGVSACISVLHRIACREGFQWSDIQGALAAIVPGALIPYWVITSLPIC
jgi:hypothetical protein